MVEETSLVFPTKYQTVEKPGRFIVYLTVGNSK
jgi:hypothetical protein